MYWRVWNGKVSIDKMIWKVKLSAQKMLKWRKVLSKIFQSKIYFSNEIRLNVFKSWKSLVFEKGNTDGAIKT